MSSLKNGQPVTLEELERASTVLSNWGYFSAVRFSYKYSGTAATVTFVVEDEKRLFTTLFDNFPQLSDQEITSAIRAEYPSFNGKVPSAGTANDYVAGVIQRLLAKTGNQNKVSSAPLLRGPEGQMVFKQSPESPMCSIALESADRMPEEPIVSAVKRLENRPYSRLGINQFFETDLVPLARREGFWRFELVNAGVANGGGCANGTPLRLQVRYGSSYSWGKANWIGNAHQAASVLDGLIDLQPGQVARLNTIQTGLAKTSKLYWNNGYLDVSLKPDPVIDDQNRTLNYRVQIDEGEQYKMGELVCGKANERGPCDSLKSRWKLKPAESFNGNYFDEFERTAFADWLKQFAGQPVKLKLLVQKNPTLKVANVVVVNAQ